MSAFATDRAKLTGFALLVLAPLFCVDNFIIGRAKRGQLPPFAIPLTPVPQPGLSIGL